MNQPKFILTSLVAVAIVSGCGRQSQEGGQMSRAEIVDPFIGTDYTGNTYPGAQTPHGMVQLSPDNGLPGWDRIAGYYYQDSTIAGFSHTHLSGTGAGDLYDISFMPAVKPYRISEKPLGLHSKFNHASEEAHAGYYKVTLSDYDIDVELTATPRAGVQRYTWPGDSGTVFLNLTKATNWDHTQETGIEVIDSVTIGGYRFSDGWARNQKVWFATRFSKPFETYKIIKDGNGENAEFGFVTSKGEQLTVTTALSGVSLEGALLNLRTEAPDDDFDKYRLQAVKLWNEKLGRIDVETADESKKRVFYTALYHSLLAPTLYSDVDGRYMGPDGNIHTCIPGHNHYHTFSTWDTYRAAHPLYTIIEPDVAADMAQSLLDFAEQSGQMPVWTMWGSETDMMIGYHSVPIIVDAILKGIGDIDADKALELSVATARNSGYRGLGQYIAKGYVPCDVDSSWAMSKGLEYSFDDYSICQLARHLGKDSIAEEFERRAEHYKANFNSENRWMQPRLSDGRFLEPFSPDSYTPPICESNAWHYLWSVQHDVKGLETLLGGRDSMENRLDQMFSIPVKKEELPIFSTGMIGQYAQGNEPSHHVAYLYNYVGKPEKARRYIHRIMNEFYTDRPDGLCGNEDCGQMSAWYVLSALGFYPVNPVGGVYDTGYPLFGKAVINLPTGRHFTISASETPDDTSVKVRLNGRDVDNLQITHSDIVGGGILEFSK